MSRLPLLVLVLAACYTAPSTVAPEHAPTPIAAGMDRAWNAVIDVFAERNIPIRTIDRSSGFVATEALQVAGVDSLPWADCGSGATGDIRPQVATYNVRVRGDSAHSTVRITVRWSADVAQMTNQVNMAECVTTGRWEAAAEKDVKARAEGSVP